MKKFNKKKNKCLYKYSIFILIKSLCILLIFIFHFRKKPSYQNLEWSEVLPYNFASYLDYYYYYHHYSQKI